MGPPRESRGPGNLVPLECDRRNEKQNKFLCSPLAPPADQPTLPPPPRWPRLPAPPADRVLPRVSAAHFGGGIRHYLEPPRVYREGRVGSLACEGQQSALAVRKRSISRCELSTAHFRRPPWESSSGSRGGPFHRRALRFAIKRYLPRLSREGLIAFLS